MTVQDIIDNLQNTPESILATYQALRKFGRDDEGARNAIFIELGGGDVVLEGEDGAAVYQHSGVPVGSINWPPELEG